MTLDEIGQYIETLNRPDNPNPGAYVDELVRMWFDGSDPRWIDDPGFCDPFEERRDVCLEWCDEACRRFECVMKGEENECI